ncbi:HD-GYP domain-containing protein [Treponema sp. JC4]|uniref:HD-GYP domain-containing protein n=1 Tax=Treponema sp. JC4 TaxID=1124982 RepID=UPI0006826008|nr:HD domain-containing phosphohydrolase [Treponema sp. JC4]
MKNRIKQIIFYCLFIFLNISVNRLMGYIKVPLFLDNIGTLSAAILGGYLPGVIVGYLTNIINSTLTDLTNSYYAGISVLIAVAGAFFARRGYFNSFRKALITIPVFALLGGGIGSILTYCIYGFGVGEGISAPFVKNLLEQGTLNVFWAQLISDMIIDFIDKALTVFGVLIFLRIIPENFSKTLMLTDWKQTPLNLNERINARQTKTRQLPLRTKITLMIAVIMIFVAFVTTAISYVLYVKFAMSVPGISVVQAHMEGISFIAKILSLFLGFFIFILTLCLWLSNYHLTYPIAAMSFASEDFAYNSEEDIEIGLERMKSLEIATGDEIENLYKSLTHTISQTVNYIDDVQKKGEEIAHMQNGLIYIMADLVESRDKCTGDHVRKTAEYVKLILQLLKENNLFPDMLTEEYIQDVCSSAPLHDVGKIKVSDVILNKPGKLTDEEFEIMKSHTLAGKEVIESAMQLTTDPGYLKEASNLATFHHEKWNGTGYPMGLKAEEIPLSARIMAVSDVFDALVSKRSYKEPFSFEKAMDIIREGAGTHFDPIIADVFVNNAARVKKVFDDHARRF